MHSVSSDSSDERTSYNQAGSNLDAADLLNEMRFGNWKGFCLAHLFTNIDFPSGLLGLANIASPFAGQTGGICSQGKFRILFIIPIYVATITPHAMLVKCLSVTSWPLSVYCLDAA